MYTQAKTLQYMCPIISIMLNRTQLIDIQCAFCYTWSQKDTIILSIGVQRHELSQYLLHNSVIKHKGVGCEICRGSGD